MRRPPPSGGVGACFEPGDEQIFPAGNAPEHEPEQLGPPVVQMAVELPREAHAAVGLDVLLGRVEIGLAGADAGRRRGHGKLGRVGRQRPRPVERVRPRQLDRHVHVGELVLDRLERGDGPAEGEAADGVLARHVERGLAATHLLEGDQHRCPVEQALDEGPARSGLAERLRRRVREGDRCHRSGGIDRFERRPAHAGGVQIHQVERHATTVPRRHHGEIRHVPIDHRSLGPGEPARFGAGGQTVRGRCLGSLGEGEAADRLAGGDPGQPVALLRVGSSQEQCLDGEVDGRGEGSRRNAAPELLGEHAELEVAESRPPVALGDRGAGPPHLRHAMPELGIIGRIAVEDAADPGGRGMLGEELPRLVAQRFLIRREVEIHGVGLPDA